MVKIVANLLPLSYFILAVLVAGTGDSLPIFSHAFSPSSRIGINSNKAAIALSSTIRDNDDASQTDNNNRSNNISTSSRREALRQTLTTTLSTIAILSPKPAHADVTNKIASTTALRALTRAQDQLPIKLLPEAQKNNYVGIKARLREPPFDTLRKNMLVLVRGGEDGPKANELQAAYKQLIAALEAIDATASLGLQKRDVDPFRLGAEYDAVVKAFDAFVQVGMEAASIPLQYN